MNNDFEFVLQFLFSAYRFRARRPENQAPGTLRLRRLLAICVVLLWVTASSAQDPAAGLIPFSTQAPSGDESVDLATSNIFGRIPIRSKSGKLPFWHGLTMNSHAAIVNNSWSIVPPFTQGFPGARLLYTTSLKTINCSGTPGHYIAVTNFFITDVTNAEHSLGSFNLIWQWPAGAGCGTCPSTCASGTAVAIDGSGYTLVATSIENGNSSTFTVYDRSGNIVNPQGGGSSPTILLQDPDGTQLSSNIVNSTLTYVDTLDATALTTSSPPPSPPAPQQLTYTDAAGNPQTFQLNYSTLTQQTKFGCPGISDRGPISINLLTTVTTPVGNISIGYEPTPGDMHNPPYTTGRVSSIVYPSGATVSFGYSGGNNGIACVKTFPTVPTLTKTVRDSLGNASTWTYVNTNNGSSSFTVTVTDPANNQTVYNFVVEGSGGYQTQAQYYEGSANGGTLLKTVVTCYNGNNSSKSTCLSTGLGSAPGVFQTDIYTYLGTSTSPSLTETVYDDYGNTTSVSNYDFGATFPPSGAPVSKITSVYDIESGSSYPCGTLTIPYIYDRACSVTTVNSSGATVSQTTYTYNSAGHGITMSRWVKTGSTLSSSTSYNPNGTVNVSTDINGTTNTYSYDGSCNSLKPTGLTVAGVRVTLATSMTWDCNGDVEKTATDENGNVTSTNYFSGTTADPFYRPLSAVDALNNTTTFGYTTSTFESAMNFNGTISTSDVLTTTDGLARTLFSQRRQGQGSSTFDSTQIVYGWTQTTQTVPGGSIVTKSVPYSGTSAQPAPTGTAVTTTQYDALNRPITITDGGGGTVSYTYIRNDVLQVSGPGQTFQRQLEYDGLGRLTSVCEVTSVSGSGSCGQSNAATGFLTKYTYDALGHLLTVTQNAQPGAVGGTQARSYSYDGIGRLISETNPETGQAAPGTVNYTYDAACGSYSASAGDITKRVDNAGNTTCYQYDGLHRLIDAGNGGPSCRHLRYDNNVTPPTGVAVSNTKARLVEAYTDACTGSKTTDEWFSYDADGRTTDVYEQTPHSGTTYYHTSACYWPNGSLETLSGIPSVPALYYGGGNCTSSGSGLDGEGRVTKVSAASGTNPVTSVSYALSTTTTALAGSLTGVSFGSGDSDNFTYDPKTGRTTSYQASVNGNTDTGTLTWSPNAMLATLKIVDNLPGSIDSQTCNYFYDDFARLAGKSSNGYSVDCGSIWQQLFSLDPFGNISKSGNLPFVATYSSTTNHITNLGFSYDANGNVKTDYVGNTYSWDSNFGNMASVNGINLIYDAFGRMVEQQGSANTEILYSPAGKSALMNGQILLKAFVYLPGSGTAIYNSSGLAYFRHPDWLGSARVTSTAGRAPYSIVAYAPFGEQYAVSGTADPSFTGQNSDTVGNLYDFQYREDSPSSGRWISPDPAGLTQADSGNPQSWNRYAYVLNSPLAATDPFGLWCVWEDNSHDDDPQDIDSNSRKGEKANCEKQGGHWDQYDTITGIMTDDSGNVTQISYKVSDGSGTILTYNPAGMTLEGFDQTLNSYEQQEGGNVPRNYLGQPEDSLGLWFDRTRLGRFINRRLAEEYAWEAGNSRKMDWVACGTAPDGNNDIHEVTAMMHGEKPSPADEGHPEGGKPVWIPNTGTKKNGGGATRMTPWGVLVQEPGNESQGEENQGGPGSITLAASWASATGTCLQK